MLFSSLILPSLVCAAGATQAASDDMVLWYREPARLWVEALPEEHLSRVITQGDLRPMAKNDEAMEDLKAILKAREPYHRMADAAIQTSGETIAESLEQLHAVVLRLLGPESMHRQEPVLSARG